MEYIYPHICIPGPPKLTSPWRRKLVTSFFIFQLKAVYLQVYIYIMCIIYMYIYIIIGAQVTINASEAYTLQCPRGLTVQLIKQRPTEGMLNFSNLPYYFY